jgi:hypothetical protein
VRPSPRTDTYGNVATSYTGSQTVAFSGPSVSPNLIATHLPRNRELHLGRGHTASVTLVKAQSTSLTATQGTIAGTSGSFTVSANGIEFVHGPDSIDTDCRYCIQRDHYRHRRLRQRGSRLDCGYELCHVLRANSPYSQPDIPGRRLRLRSGGTAA